MKTPNVMCDFEVKDLKHFLQHCKQYSAVRNELKFVQQPYKREREREKPGK